VGYAVKKGERLLVISTAKLLLKVAVGFATILNPGL
jgi:hypothetical protein